MIILIEVYKKTPTKGFCVMKNICYIIQSWHIGGIETAIYNITNQLKNDFNFHFIATGNPDIHPRYKKIGTCIYLGEKWDKITQYIRDNNVDILQWGNVTKYKECGIRAGAKVIERISGPRSINTDHSNIDHMICSSNGIEKSVKKIYNGPTTIIKNGIEIKEDLPRERFGFSSDSFIVVYPAARMGQGQSYDSLIMATIIANKQNPKIKLVLMGDRPNQKGYPNIKPQLKKLAAPLGDNCIFTGFVNNPSSIINGSDLCVVPAKTHGISNALIEAASYGKPLVASDVGQTNEICIDKYNGLLFDFGNINKMANHIIKLSNDKILCEKFGKNGIDLIRKEHNINTQTDKYRQLYNLL
jgi:glycosyltransferase involved in cell wall biosynthesis